MGLDVDSLPCVCDHSLMLVEHSCGAALIRSRLELILGATMFIGTFVWHSLLSASAICGFAASLLAAVWALGLRPQSSTYLEAALALEPPHLADSPQMAELISKLESPLCLFKHHFACERDRTLSGTATELN
jgi:hypothetical protein